MARISHKVVYNLIRTLKFVINGDRNEEARTIHFGRYPNRLALRATISAR